MAAGPKEGRKVKKRAAEIPRLATLDWLRAVQHSLMTGCGKTFNNFGPKACEVYIARDRVPPTLTVCMDQEQKQWTGLNYLIFGQQVAWSQNCGTTPTPCEYSYIVGVLPHCGTILTW